MSENSEISGRWWIDGQSKSPLAGILSVEGRLELKISIHPGTPAAQVYGNLSLEGLPKVPHVIHGRDSEDKPVVLYGCTCHSRTRASGEVLLEISALAGVQGLDIDYWQTPAIKTVTVRIEHLHRWLQCDVLKTVQLSDGKQAWVAKDYSEEKYTIAEGIDLRIIESSHESHGQDRDLFRPDCRIGLTFATPRSLDEICDKWTNWVAHFLSLLVGTSLRVEEISVSDLDLFKEDDSIEAALAFSTNQAKVLGRGQSKARVRNSNPNPFDMPASYSAVKGQLESMLQRWHAMNDELEALVKLFTTVVFHHALYSTAEFLFLVQALEVYHGHSGHFPSWQLQADELKKRRKHMVALAPPEYADWVKEKLSQNHKHLGDRITEVFQANQSLAQTAFGDLTGTAERIAYTRNYFTHYNGNTDHKKFLDQDAMARVNWSLEQFLWVILLKELGAPASAFDQIMRRVKTASFTSLTLANVEPEKFKQGCLPAATALASLLLIAGYLFLTVG